MSEWFTAAGTPANRGSLLSLPIRTQLSQIGTAFAKLPDFTGNASKLLAFNSGATAVEAVTSLVLSIAFTKTDAVDLTDNGNALNVGTLAGAHLAFSPAIIQAKSSATAAAALAINSLGGAVNIGGAGTSVVSLLFGNVAVLGSQVNGIIVGTGANLSPTSGGVGYLQLYGSGYVGYATLDATAMYLGHNSASRNLVLQTDETDRMTVGADGRIVLGAGAVATAVDVAVRGSTNDDTMIALATYSLAGNLLSSVRNDGLMNFGSEANSPYNLTTASAANMHITAANNVARSTSSIKYKKDVENASHGLDDLLSLRSVVFKSKGKFDNPNRIYGGLIAEEVHDAGLTEFVSYNEEGEPEGVAYTHMVALCIKSIQQLHAVVDDLAKKIDQKK